MNFGEIFSQTWKDYKLNFKSILKFILLFIGIPAFIFSIINISLVLSNEDLKSLVLSNNFENSSKLFLLSTPYLISIIITGLISILIYLFVFSSLTNISIKKKTFNVKDLISSGKKSLWKYLLFSIVYLFFIFLLSLLLIIPGIIFLFYWILGDYVLFDRNKGIMDSLKISKNLVKGRWWRVFGYSILIGLILIAIVIGVSMVSSILLLPFYLIKLISTSSLNGPITPLFYIASTIISFISQVTINIIIWPIYILFYKNLYLDFKKSKK